MTRTGADRLLMVGLSHRRASLDLRERVVVRPGELDTVLHELRASGSDDAVVVSTCSRTEVYTLGGPVARDDLLRFFERRAGKSAAQVRDAAQAATGGAVVGHLFRVTAGLCSPVLGEADVHGQVRAAYRGAQAVGMAGGLLAPLFTAALQCSTDVRERTGIAMHGRSLARRAVEVGLQHLGPADPRILVVGSGLMARTAVEQMHAHGLLCRVTARDEASAARLVDSSLVRSLSTLVEEIARSDLLICATSASQPIVTFDDVDRAMRSRGAPLTVVDLAVPRNVERRVAAVEGVRLVDLTGLNDDALRDPVLRAALEAADEAVGVAARAFIAEVAARDAGPVIAALRRRVEETCVTELSQLAAQGTSTAELARSARAVARRLLHPATLVARQAAVVGDAATLRMLCDTYGVPLRLED
jgi:glutamyl-tRNA reductase